MRKLFRNVACVISLFLMIYAHKTVGQIIYKDLSAGDTYKGEYNVVTKKGASATGIVTFNDASTNIGLSFNVTITSTGDMMDFSTAEYEIYLNSNLSLKYSTQNSVDVPEKLTNMITINNTLIPDTDVLNAGSNDKKYILEIKKSSPALNTNHFWGSNRYLGFRYKTTTTNYYGWLEFRLDRLTEGAKQVGFTVQLLKMAYDTKPMMVSETGLERIVSFDINMANIYKDMDSSNNVKFTIPHKTIGNYAMSILKKPAETSDTFTVAVSNTDVLDYSNGLITTKKNGNTDITITAASGYVATVKMVVGIVQPSRLEIKPLEDGETLSITLKKGNLLLKVVPTPLNTNNLNIEWTIEPNPNLITSLNPRTGELVADVGNGNIVVKATQLDNSVPVDSRVSTTATISISNQDPLPTLVQSISLTLPQLGTNTQSINLDVGATTQITAEVLPSNADVKGLDYISLSNSCSVDPNGLIIGVSAGPCQIRASARDGSGVQEVTPIITIERVGSLGTIKDFSWNPLTGIINVGESVGVNVTFNPENVSNKTLSWSSSNENIIKITNEVNVNEVSITGVSKGVASITASTIGGITLSKVVQLEVKTKRTNFIPVQDFSISPNIRSVSVGGKINLTPLFTPYNSTNQNVKWETSDATIMSIVQDPVPTEEATARQAIGSALKVGTVEITATSLENNALIRKYTIVVENGSNVLITNLQVSYSPKNGKTIINIGDVLTPSVVIEPASPSVTQLLYLSSKPDVATVDQEGNVRAVKIGSTVISSFVTDGSMDSQGGRLKSSFELVVAKSSGLQITGLTEEKLIQDVQVYPNPIRDFFVLNLNDDIIYPINVEIVSIQGQSIWSKRVLNATDKIYINNKIPSSVYILKVTSDFNKYSTRIKVE